METIKVMVVDDHAVFREGLCRLLEDEIDLEVVAKPENGEEAVALAKELSPDVVIIDIAMPGLNGIQATAQIKAACPETAIIMLSAYSYDSYFLASVQAGAAGYMLKSTPFAQLVSAVRLVHAKEAVFDVRLAGRLIHPAAGRTGKEIRTGCEPNLRELQVLMLVARGASNKAIATELGISHRTVQGHLVNIFRRLGVASRTEAVLCALKEGWLNIDDLYQDQQT